MFWKKIRPVWCPICHLPMTNVDYKKVNCNVAREFARLNMWDLLSKNGWYVCPDCKIHIHEPTVGKQKGKRKY